MPELVPSRSHWGWSKNHSGSLFENDRGAALNNGSEWVVTVWLAGREAMLAYGPHPKHQELMALQSSKLTPDGKLVLGAHLRISFSHGYMYPNARPLICHAAGLQLDPPRLYGGV